MAVFEGRKTDRLLWQPRLHHWYGVNKARGTLPRRYVGRDILEVYDDLKASPRGYHFYDQTLKLLEGENVKLATKEDENSVHTKYMTPIGNLTQVEKKNIYATGRMRIEYLLKGVEDFRVLSYIVRNQRFEFDEELFKEIEGLLDDRCEPLLNIPWGSIMRLLIVYMGFEKGTVAIYKHRAEVEELLRVFDESDSDLFDLVAKMPFRIVNFLDNIDEGLISPTLFTKYMMPYYRRRTKEIHQAGKFCTSHWDGKVKGLLAFAKDTGLDGLECVPPSPQGNVSVQELRVGLKNMILCDGIPATHFLPTSSDLELKRFVNTLVESFSPRLIVGISDMMPPDGEIERARMIGKVLEDYRI